VVSRQAPCAVVMVQPGAQRPVPQASEVGEALPSATAPQPAAGRLVPPLEGPQL
jgi:hypothetical protein